jgi:hypothetical protein
MRRSFYRFGYLRDPLFLFCIVLYALNRIVIKPNCEVYFFHAWLNDVICIPFTLPLMLWVLRLLRLRFHDEPPKPFEILIPLFIISWSFEVYLPNTEMFRNVTVADRWDVLAYSVGAIASGTFWFFWYQHNSET